MSVSAGAPPSTFPSGVSTSPGNYVFAQLPFVTPPRLNQWFDDFNSYVATTYTVVGATGTNALSASANGGKLISTTSGLDDDIQGIQLATKSFAFTSGSQVWFSVNVALTDATDCDFIAGLANAFTSLTQTDGVYFKKLDGSTTLNLIVTAGSASTTIPVGTMANATAYTFSFYYNADPVLPTLFIYSTIPYTTSDLAAPTAFGIPYYSGGQACVASANANGGSDTAGTYVLTNLPATSTNLTAGVVIQAGSAAVRIMTTDYLYAGEEIVARY